MEKSLINYKHLLALDLSSYGSALAIINQFCDDDQIKVFEISPVGYAGLLILLIKEETAADILKNEVISFFKSNLLSVELLKNFDSRILEIYLSQNKSEVSTSLLIQEFSFVSQAFKAAHALLVKDIQLIDFRVIRTYPLNAILISTAIEGTHLIQHKDQLGLRSSMLIDHVEPVLKQFFQST